MDLKKNVKLIKNRVDNKYLYFNKNNRIFKTLLYIMAYYELNIRSY